LAQARNDVQGKGSDDVGVELQGWSGTSRAPLSKPII